MTARVTGAYERAVGVLVARLPGLDAATRRDVAATALAADTRLRSRAAELASLAGLLVELAARRQTRGRRGLVWLHGAVAGLVLAAAVTLARPTGTALVVVGVLLPAAALLVAHLDPRLAVAALVFWTWRLALADLDHAVDAVAALDGGLLVRWCAMCCGIAVAAHVARRWTRRDAAI